MVSAYRSTFRVVLVLVFMFIALKTFGIFPLEAEGAIRSRSFIARSGAAGSYHSNYGGRYVYRGFGSSSNSRRKSDENLQEADQRRLYYEKKMAEWREKKSNKMANSSFTTEDLNEAKVNDTDLSDQVQKDVETDFDDVDDAEDASSQYDYENYVEPTTPTATTKATTVRSSNTGETGSQSSNDGNSNETSSVLSTATARTVATEASTERSLNAATAKPTRKIYGYRYGRVKVEKL